MDVQNLSSLISALRAETSAAALTPESIGALLQKIVDVLALAAEQTDLALVEQWKSLLQNIGFVNVGIAPGSADGNNVFLSEKRLSLSNGSTYREQDSVLLQQASTARAGIMGAQHVKDINALKSAVGEFAPELERLSSVLSSLVVGVKIDGYTSYKFSNGFVPNGSPSDSIYIHVFFKNNTVSSSLVYHKKEIWHLNCYTSDGVLYINNGTELLNSGYVPYLFRYTLKRNRLKDPDGVKKYIRGPKKRGWHVFHSHNIIRVSPYNNSVSFDFINDKGELGGFYKTHPVNLVRVRMKYKDNKLFSMKVGYGKRTIQAINGRRFKFGIAFANGVWAHGFDYSSLVTNIAPFYVNVHPYDDLSTYDVCFSI